MDRRELVVAIGAFGICYPAAQIGGAIIPALAEPTSPPLVWDLEPDTSLPEGYEGFLTEAEKSKILRECASRRSRMACFPILEGELPATHQFFHSYSLFLISNPEWLGFDSSKKIASLYKSYEAFARAIGNDHAAVFFWKKKPKHEGGELIGANLASNIDASRCADYAKAFKLDISLSPYVVVTTKRPSPDSPMGDSILMQLNGLSPNSTEQFLSVLAAQLVSAKLDQTTLDSKRWWLTWQDIFTNLYQRFKDVVGHSKVTIKAGPVEYEVDGKN